MATTTSVNPAAAVPGPAGTSFADRLAQAVDRCGAPVCIGLDPVYEKLPAELRCGTPGGGPVASIARFCEGVLEAAAGIIPVVKPQSACFERYGSAGVACLEHVCRRARELGYLVLLDVKRGDIGVTAEHYAAACFGALGADAVTVSPYLGPDTLEPFVNAAEAGRAEAGGLGRGVFVLVRTSNPGSDAVQSPLLNDGRSVAELVASQVAALGAARRGACGLSSVGAVVGATKAADGAALRRRMPDQVFLIPGYGAQGGTAEDIRGMLRAPAGGGPLTPGTSGVLVTASRSVIYAFVPGGGGGEAPDWQAAVATAARSFAAELRRVVE